MNSFILMAEIVQDPQLRYTTDGQTAIAEMMVQFPGLRDSDPVETVKVVGWGNLAQEIQTTYHQGDRVVIEGRLGMNTVERPEGFREKIAEFTAQRVYRLGADTAVLPTDGSAAMPTPTPTPAPAPPIASPATPVSPSQPYTPPAQPYTPPADPEPNFDDIPF
jgi:single-stranded DNA-binding protein